MRKLLTCLQDENGLPDHILLITFNNVSCFFSLLLFIFSIYIFYMAPVSKESLQYKIIIYMQFVFVYAVSFLWSFISKIYIDYEYYIIYSEGFLASMRVNSGQFFTFFAVIFGIYSSFLMLSYIYRLHAIANQDHFIKRKQILPISYILIFLNNAVLGPTIFFFGYQPDVDLRTHKGNLTDAEIQFYVNRAFVLFPPGQLFTRAFVLYMFCSVVFAIATVYSCSYSIANEIKKQQASASSKYIKHHKRILKSLLIQTTSSLSVLCLVPLVETTMVFIRLSSCFVELSYAALGYNFIIHSMIMLLLNSLYRKTIYRKLLKRPHKVVVAAPPSRNAHPS